jgi:hypothetical protein
MEMSMPKGTDFHKNHDGIQTDKKFRPEDEGIYQQEKREFQNSEQDKKADAMSEDEFITEQDKKTEG